MTFNVKKCKVLHFNKCEDNHYDYYMTDQHTMCQMTSTTQEKDIGVIFDNNLQFNSHITTTVKKCQQILSIIKRSFDFIDENIILTTNSAACVCVCVYVQNLTISALTHSFRLQTSRKFCSHSKIPIRCLWTAFCVPLSFIFYERQSFRMQIVTLRRSRSPLCGRLTTKFEWHNPFSLRGSVATVQRENVVHSGMQQMQRSRFEPRAGNNIFFSFLLFAINKAYF